jgi:uncharacterized protein (DUF302 family)
MSPSLLITRSTARPLEEVCQALPDIAQRHQFGVLATHDLRQKMETKGVPFGRECRVIEVCNPRQASLALTAAIEIATALPCRIAVYEENGATVLATVKPTSLLALFGAPGAAAVAAEVEAAMVRIMDEASAS